MPELPEVETVRRTLEKNIVGLTISGVELKLPKIIRSPAPEEFTEQVTGKKITAVKRRGKYLLLFLDRETVLVIHLRMTGQMVYARAETARPKHTHLIFALSDGNQLRYTDIRQFGTIILTPQQDLDKVKGLSNLGPEPLEPGFTKGYLRRELKRRRARIKSLLLEQTFVAGLGNIYADEALYKARLHPERLASSLSPREVANLYQAIVDVLQAGIENRGTSMRDYVDGDGRTGNFQKLLQVYSRQGECCRHCGCTIERIKVGGRSSYHCPECQKPK